MGRYSYFFIFLGIVSSSKIVYHFYIQKDIIPYRKLNIVDDELTNTNPFSVLEKYNKQDLYLCEISNMLYSPPLTNKLFVYSNLYGHELIRYYDY
jgi:hypothetical protein